MLEYVRKCKASYDVDGTACDYVRCVLREAELAARYEHVVKKGTEAIVNLSKRHSKDRFFTEGEINKAADFTSKYPRAGLWPWLSHQADVIEEESGRKAYRIKTEFYDAMLKCLGM